jgi:hypothetical protein
MTHLSRRSYRRRGGLGERLIATGDDFNDRFINLSNVLATITIHIQTRPGLRNFYDYNYDDFACFRQISYQLHDDLEFRPNFRKSKIDDKMKSPTPVHSRIAQHVRNTQTTNIAEWQKVRDEFMNFMTISLRIHAFGAGNNFVTISKIS